MRMVKYFLDIAPKDDVIEASSLTKFRKLRLIHINLLDILINKKVAIALEKGIIKFQSIIVDATHSKSRYNQRSPVEILQDSSKKLHEVVYEVDENEYCQKLLNTISTNKAIATYPKVKERLRVMFRQVAF